MNSNVYPVGTRIKFTYEYEDTGKIGTIVNINSYGVDIYLPTGDKHIQRNYYPTLNDGTKFTWHTQWQCLELVAQKGEQLLFDFMKE